MLIINQHLRSGLKTKNGTQSAIALRLTRRVRTECASEIAEKLIRDINQLAQVGRHKTKKMKKELIKVGMPVIYWKVIKDDGQRFDPIKTEIASEVWELGHGEEVCKVKGVSGGISIKHLDEITPGSLMAAKMQGLKGVCDNDMKEHTEKFFKDRGVKCTVSMG